MLLNLAGKLNPLSLTCSTAPTFLLTHLIESHVYQISTPRRSFQLAEIGTGLTVRSGAIAVECLFSIVLLLYLACFYLYVTSTVN